ncbi:MAG: hypothetical protein ACRCU5_00495, partial [Rhizobiaceae bacterium]
VDEQLAGTTTALAEQTEKVSSNISTSARMMETNITRLTDLSSGTLKEVASIASRFDEHGRVLASASDLLNAAQSSLSNTLEDRQEALERLSVGLVTRSEEIEKTLRAFENLVVAAFEKAESRAGTSTQAMKHSLAEVVEQATTRFAEATEEMRRTASEIRVEIEAAKSEIKQGATDMPDEMRRSTAAIRAEIEATKAEIRKGVKEMPEDARRAAAEIRAELEETRAELRKGVNDLPEETKLSTQTMRRAVSEQINALKELSEIVGKSGRAFDVATAAPARAMATASARSEARAPEPMREAPRRAPEPALRGTIAADTAPAPSSGWVSDLLKRASREEGPASPTPGTSRSPLHVVESLNSLSVDIARAIDHEASVDLWDRYRRGERNVFTRRLYTIKGQQTFDDIRRKYQTDGDFRGAVNRYIEDFERLLQDVARNDRDNIMTQTYLTSDTGKVYTMLAHASGKLK